MKNTYLVLTAAFASFIALGFFDGGFAVAWPVIRYDMGLHLGQAGIVISVNSALYTLSASQFGRVSQFVRPEKINLLGIISIILGMLGISFSVDLTTLTLAAGLVGIGMGMIDPSMNSYVAKHFSSRHMSWLHCFWSVGATISPLIMSQMIIFASWRAGYVTLMSIQVMIAAVVLVSLISGAWATRETTHADIFEDTSKSTFLTKKRYHNMNVLIFFVYVGMEYSTGFWTASVLIDSRGLDIDSAAMYPAVYFASIMVGRVVCGYLTKRYRNITMIRAGFALGITGLVILAFSNSILGMALVGLGFAPIFPCLMHETAKLFGPDALSKLVGYQVAAAGAGVALLGPTIGLVLSHVSLEALFPLVVINIAFVFVLNEVIDNAAARKARGAV